MVTRLRKGFIKTSLRHHGLYYSGYLGVGGRVISRCSYDRSVVERWLADRLAENPICEIDTNRAMFRETMAARRMTMGERPVPRSNPFAGARLVTSEAPSLWAVVAECDPMTVHYHLFVRADWPHPEKVLNVDEVNCVPIVWVADDNHGEGYRTEAAAREAARSLSGGGAVAYRVRPYAGEWETRDGWRVRRNGR